MTQSQKLATEVGMAGGTLSGVIATYSHDVLKTVVCACVGATVSFFVTLALKWVVKKIFKK